MLTVCQLLKVLYINESVRLLDFNHNDLFKWLNIIILKVKQNTDIIQGALPNFVVLCGFLNTIGDGTPQTP